MEELKLLVELFGVRYPHLRLEVEDIYQLCLDEIEQGGSVQHEVENCIYAIEDLIN